MEDQQPIEELFRETLQHHEEPVNPELWDRISRQLQAPVTEPLPNTDPASTAVNTSGWMGGSALQWIAAAVITLSAGTGAYLYLANRADETMKNDQPAILEQKISQHAPETETPATEVSATAEQDNKVIGNIIVKDKGDANTVEIETPPVVTGNLKPASSHGNVTPESSSPAAPVPATPTNDVTSVKNGHPNPIIESPGALTTGILTAMPVSGTAPLKVSLRYKGEADRLQWDFGDGQTHNLLNQVEHTFAEPGVYTVTLKGMNQQQKQVTETLTIKVLADLTITGLPNVLTPNYDGLNDVFSFNSSQFAEIEVNIYDQAGNMVHRFRDTEAGWDGKLSNGKEAVEGTYIYIIFARSNDQRKHQQKGLLRLIR